MIHTIHKDDELFPDCLRAIGDDCPETIYALGNLDLLKAEHMVAIIGSRACSSEGSLAAHCLASSLATKGHVIVSGLALGCDTAAHVGCLAVGGKTIAVVATGLDRVHPKQNVELQNKILGYGDKHPICSAGLNQNTELLDNTVATGGLIISEQPLGVKANPTRLIARNRIQAALAETIIVAECPIHSGTMHTVEFAQKYGKTIRTVKFNESSELNSGNRFIVEQCIGEYMPLLELEDGSKFYTFKDLSEYEQKLSQE